MFTVLAFLLAGIVFGFLLRRYDTILRWADKATMWAIYGLIFLLGVSVGVNQLVMRSLGHLGLQAFILSSGAVLGSVLLCHFVSILFFKPQPAYHEE